MKIKIYPYKNGSASAKALADALSCRVVKREGKEVIADAIINWGSSSVVRSTRSKVFLNLPENIGKAANKLHTFGVLSDVKDTILPIKLPVYTTQPDEEFINSSFERGGIVVRHILTGHSGNGIQMVDNPDQLPLPKAPLYVQYIKRREEYRVHVFKGQAFFVQRKARKMDVPDERVNWKIRNLAGGFIYASEGVTLPPEVLEACGKIMELLGVDFGAIDLLYSSSKEYYFLEVNTAPGLAGTTLEKYSEKFTEYLNHFQ